MSAINPEMESLKTRLKSMWMAGDFGEVAKHIEADAEEFIARLALKPETACSTSLAAAATWRSRRRVRARL